MRYFLLRYKKGLKYCSKIVRKKSKKIVRSYKIFYHKKSIELYTLTDHQHALVRIWAFKPSFMFNQKIKYARLLTNTPIKRSAFSHTYTWAHKRVLLTGVDYSFNKLILICCGNTAKIYNKKNFINANIEQDEITSEITTHPTTRTFANRFSEIIKKWNKKSCFHVFCSSSLDNIIIKTKLIIHI